MDYQFAQPGLACLCAATWSGNVRMVRVAEKCGFSLTNREVGKREVRGGRYDGLTFALTREQWMERKGA
jgi:RimJ/RimL family protein N-acetyltransferase